MGTPQAGVKYTGWDNIAIIAFYHGNGTMYEARGFYGSPVGSHR